MDMHCPLHVEWQTVAPGTGIVTVDFDSVEVERHPATAEDELHDGIVTALVNDASWLM